MAFTETHTTTTDNPLLAMMEMKGLFSNHSQRKKQGVALVVQNPFFTLTKLKELPGRFLKATVSAPGKMPIIVAVIYSPADSPRERTTFFQQLQPDLSNVNLLFGDFNCVMQEEDWSLVLAHWLDSLSLHEALVAVGLIDALPPSSPHTFTSPSSYTTRLNRVYYAPNSVRAPKCLTLNNLALSDHSLLLFEVRKHTH